MSNGQVQEFYDSIAATYDAKRFAKPYYQQIDKLEQTFVLDKVSAGATVLEIGPGTGRFTARLVEKAATVTAIDISEQMLSQLRTKIPSSHLKAYHLSVHELNLLADYGRFDTVICMRVLPHLETPVPALTAMSQAVKPSGNIVFDLWNPYSFIGAIRKLFRRPSSVLTKHYSYGQMLRMLEASGLTVKDKLAWGYPRVGSVSLDRLGNSLFKPLGYSLIFDTVPNRTTQQ